LTKNLRVKIPIAYSKKLNRYVGIQEVESGRDQFFCDSCKMELTARKGDKNADHFAHYDSALDECEISYWVSVRDIAINILRKTSSIALPPFFNLKLSKYANPKIIDVSTKDGMDLLLHTPIVDIHICIVTPEHSCSKAKFNLIDSIVDRLFLFIDISSIKDKKNTLSYLNNLLIRSIETKKFIMPEFGIKQYADFFNHVDNFCIAEEKIKLNQSPTKNYAAKRAKKILRRRNPNPYRPNTLFEYKDVFEAFMLDYEIADYKDTKTAKALVPYYNKMHEEFDKTGRRGKYGAFMRFNKGENLWSYERDGDLMFFVQLFDRCYAFTFKGNRIFMVGERINEMYMVFALMERSFFPSNYVEMIEKEEEVVF